MRTSTGPKGSAMSRYFVTVYARSADDLRRLQKLGLDLFAQTAKKARARTEHPFSIEGLLTIKEVEALMKDGYRVLLEDTAEARSHRSGNTIEFSEWLERQQPTLAKDRAARR
jgi:hypothetical protein